MRRRLYQLAVIIISLFIIQGLSRSLIELMSQRQRLKLAERELKDIDNQIGDLNQELKYYQSDDYIEQIARDKLLMKKPGETVIILPPDFDFTPPLNQLTTKSRPETTNLPNWKKWLALFGI